MTQDYLFFFGNTPELSRIELAHIVSADSIIPVSGSIARVASCEPSAASLIDVLGGTVKISRVISVANDITPQYIADVLMKEVPEGRITFGVSLYETNTVDSESVKDVLESGGRTARYVRTTKGSTLSSVVIEKQHVTEVVLIGSPEGIVLGITEAVQPFEAWNKRDFGRPAADAKAGMLPPKVARMMINIALGDTSQGKLLADPFCGMGTVLAEAILRGCRVIGSDISEKAVISAQKNLEWLTKEYPTTVGVEFAVVQGDAVHLSDRVTPSSVDAIVTEPFLGSPEIGGNNMGAIAKQRSALKDTIKGLEKLYIGCLKDWTNVLKPGAIVVIILPQYSVRDELYTVKRVIDRCENLGYTTVVGPIEYSRPHATVTRQIYILTYGTR